MAIERKVPRSKPRSSVAARRVKKPNPVRLRSLGDLKESEMIKVTSALNAAVNLASAEDNLKKNSDSPFCLPDEAEMLRRKQKMRRRVATAMKLLALVERGYVDSGFEHTAPVTLSEVPVRRRSRSATTATIDAASNCRICGRPMPEQW
ncbi:GL12814 [Drosophila persimilis]|uniref:GL12814 n=1 Tax=Drosophila persimilis TaxID=7234 RepID=B4H7S6_DROPE|nr:uncharacterized protein LOC6601856 [Drosophila persimilis]EDW34716.1 GL12814 [Drosophila persimilis]